MLQLLTTTGCRPEAFDLCQRWMNQQTYQGHVRWIIVDDGEEVQPLDTLERNWEIVTVRPKPFWQKGQNTQKRNLREGMKRVSRDLPLVIIEDDDYYDPRWLQTCANWLEKVELLGEKNANYYNVHTRIHKQCGNQQHSSLCAMAMKGAGIDALIESIEMNEKFIDIQVWKKYKGERRLLDTDMVVGIKGMPGRDNIGIGKRLTGVEDKDMSILSRLVGEENARLYARF